MHQKRGFTILELTIVLAITSLLIGSLIFTLQNGLTYQRYKDSIYDLQAYLQNQYSEVLNPRGSVTDGLKCTFSGNLNIIYGSSKKGQSECIVLGRYIKTADDSGKKIESYPVLGIMTGTGSEDLALLKDSDKIKLDYYDGDLLSLKDSYTLRNSLIMRNPDDTKNLQFSLLILKSPTSGSVFSLIYPESVASVSSILRNDKSTKNDLIICVDRGSISANSNMGVKINANSPNSNGVSFINDLTGDCT